MKFIFDVFVAQQVRTTAERIKANEQGRTFLFVFKYLAEFPLHEKVLILLLFNGTHSLASEPPIIKFFTFLTCLFGLSIDCQQQSNTVESVMARGVGRSGKNLHIERRSTRKNFVPGNKFEKIR